MRMRLMPSSPQHDSRSTSQPAKSARISLVHLRALRLHHYLGTSYEAILGEIVESVSNVAEEAEAPEATIEELAGRPIATQEIYDVVGRRVYAAEGGVSVGRVELDAILTAHVGGVFIVRTQLSDGSTYVTPHAHVR